MRPVITQNFLDKIKITVQHFFTGSDFESPFKDLEGDQLAKFKTHVDELYDDFKQRVCEGRGIDKDVVELLAGGRVMTGWQAFALIAPRESLSVCVSIYEKIWVLILSRFWPAEMMKKIARNEFVGPESEPSQDEATFPEGEHKMVLEEASSPLEPGEGGSAQLPETSSTSTSSSSPATPSQKKQEDELKLGPMGRGLIDSLGGIHDAAVFASELYIARALAQVWAENPGMPEDEALDLVLPGFRQKQSESGNAVIMMDVNLKKFPCVDAFFFICFLSNF
jgi:hypothetical protein